MSHYSTDMGEGLDGGGSGGRAPRASRLAPNATGYGWGEDPAYALSDSDCAALEREAEGPSEGEASRLHRFRSRTGNHPFACVDDEGSIDCVCGVGNP